MNGGPATHHNGAWRHPDSDAHEVLTYARYEKLAQIYERGLFDGVFFVESHLPGFGTDQVDTIRYGGMLSLLDPLQILTVMARVTRHLGLSATMSTTFYPPYIIARAFGTLDQMSKGRAGWNVVTSFQDSDARLFGHDHILDKASRYDMADEVVEACMQLWDTWSDDALVIDRESGIFADPDKIRYSAYEGKVVRYAGGLTVPRSAQGRPVIMQAGASARGMEFAARWAEVVFSPHSTGSALRTYYTDLKGLMVDRFGRRPGDCAVLPSVDVVAGESDAEAAEYADSLDVLAEPRAAMKVLEMSLGVELKGVPLDTPLSQIVPDDGKQVHGAAQRLLGWNSEGRESTLRDAAMLQATSDFTPRYVGSAKTVVDQMEELFESGCCDGFIITHALSPDSLSRFVQFVVPELQRRGLYRTEYRGTTFRDNLFS
ncbi:MAG: NtaA/DmoA family FMN-dependent monooxygenase [Pseudonocardia sp.]|nr:NtaA/DmoA family FMN-dependent monooxygenase [Pseudonocardia sp.]